MCFGLFFFLSIQGRPGEPGLDVSSFKLIDTMNV